MTNVSKRIQKVPPYLFEEIDRKKNLAIAKGVDIIDLGIGDPDLPTPDYIVKAMQGELAKAHNHNYPSSSGEKDYRQAYADWYQKRFAVNVSPDTEVTALIGSKEGLAHLALAYLDEGDIALVPSPSYPVYLMWTLIAGATPYLMPLNAENDFLPDFSKIPVEIAKKAKILYLNYPNNPTGAIANLDFLSKAVSFAKENDLIIVYDNAYCEMTFDDYIAPSILQVKGAMDLAIEFTSLSKSYNMTGFRIGAAVGNQDIIKALRVIKSNADSGQFKAIQRAAIVALSSDQTIKEQNLIYKARRDILSAGLKTLGFDFKQPKASFYFWVKCPKGYDSKSFAEFLLDQCGIVVVPGSGYGLEGEGYIRIAITVDENKIKEAIKRMSEKLALKN